MKHVDPQVSVQIETPHVPLSLSDVQMPGLISDGMGKWLDHVGSGGFDEIANRSVSGCILGSEQSIGNDLEGTFYDFKRNRCGNYTGAGNGTYSDKIRTFIHRDWDISLLSKFYRSPRRLYTPLIVVPTCSSAVAPKAFGEKEAVGKYWMILYKGSLVHKEDVTFRFWGSGDQVMAVRVDKELVLSACWPSDQESIVGDIWQSHCADSRQYFMGNSRAVVGDWIELKAGQSRALEILLGDNGGEACAMLAVEVKGVEYARNRQGGPILPAFKTSMISRSLLDTIYKDLPTGEICLTNGPVFCDY